jgi:glycosyltransferase involved in cell wall biosynthesis
LKDNFELKHLFLNSNPWFSAVSDYSLQLALYLNQPDGVLYCSEVGHTAMQQKCLENHLPFKHLPIHRQTIISFMTSLIFIIQTLFKYKNKQIFFWTFEGREHSFCVVTKILFPFLWKNKKLIRVRGQAQRLKSNFFSRIIYNYLTNKIIFAADCIKKQVGFELNKNKTIVHYYAKDAMPQKNYENRFYLDSSFPPIDKNKLSFLVIGRFDPVKGHDYLLEAFSKANFKDRFNNTIESQLIFLGYKANINPQNIFLKHLSKFDIQKSNVNKFFLEDSSQKKQVFIIEEKINNIENLIATVSFGVIPSLGSEVICRVGVEFLQSGIPVLSSNVGALPEVLSVFSNLIFNSGDEENLKQKLEYSAAIFLEKNQYILLKDKAKLEGNNRFSSSSYNSLLNFIYN